MSDPAPEDAGDATPYSGGKPMPFALRALFCFLISDVLERVGLSILGLKNAQLTPLMLSALWLITDLLLLLLLTLRTSASRVWASVLFAIHFGTIAYELIFGQPLLWVFLDSWTQCRLILTLGIDALAIHIVTRPEVAAYLDD